MSHIISPSSPDILPFEELKELEELDIRNTQVNHVNLPESLQILWISFLNQISESSLIYFYQKPKVELHVSNV